MSRPEFNRVEDFAVWVKSCGLRCFIAQRLILGEERAQDYGFVTDADGSRVLSFGFDMGGSLGGNYGPPSQESGTGWRMDQTPYDLQTADDLRAALYAQPPEWTRGRSSGCSHCGRGHDEPRKGWQRLTTLEEHLKQYGVSSRYREWE